MVELSEHVLDEASKEGESMLVDDFLLLVERHHPHDEPGVPLEVLEAYLNALDDRTDAKSNPETVLDAIDSRLSASERWVDTDALYEVGPGRVSRYPRLWHDELGGSRDVREYVRFLRDEAVEFDRGGAGRGIPESELLNIVSVVGNTSREDVRERIESLRRRGELVEDVDQHPDAGVYLPEEADDLRNDGIDT